MNKKTKSFGIVLLALIVLCAPAAAIPGIPNQFYGRVTIDESPAADGITVSAWIDDVEYASTTTSDGTYAFLVPADELETPEKEGGVNGETVKFYINGVQAGEETFVSGLITELDLTASGVPSPTPTSTATPAPTSGGAAGGGGGGGAVTVTTTTPTPTPTATATPTATPAATPTSRGAPIPPSTPEEIATITPPRTVFGMSTPGFEAVFAVIGLLAVAYLMRRR